ncbi:aldehyde dehydrogenase family protein, partial [Pseudoalteromonas phenolica]|uniref:aldehyde dehydrogenase family protein n=1 Tax=Pseudoalteromonas phenolica TaxID=161398 RepID=UPI00110B57A8
HSSVYETFTQKLVNAYQQLKIGDPLNSAHHVGPLIDKDAVNMYLQAIEACKKEGGKFLVEGGVLSGEG